MESQISAVEEGLVAYLKDKIEAARRIAVQRGADGFPQPAVYVNIERGKCSLAKINTLQMALTVYVDVLFLHLNTEGERRKGGFAILEGIIAAVFHKRIGLDIDPFQIKGFSNSTTEERHKAGIAAFTLELETNIFFTPASDEDVVDLLRVGLNYYLQPDDGTPDASDLVTLQE